MEITATFEAADRTSWRAWLERNHDTAREIWLLDDDRKTERSVSYIDAVEEAISFGWIDGVVKRVSAHELAQRFSPRRPSGSHWSELNKERARRLIRLGLMTDAGHATLPDLSAGFRVPDDIIAALRADPDTWRNFNTFPDLYRRVRISYVDEARGREDEFRRRLDNFVKKTAANQMFGNWNDEGRL